MRDYAFTRSRIFQWMGILLSLGIIAVGYWYYQSQASTLNKSPTGSLTSGLIGYWTFDASSTTSSTATDQGSGGNNGTLTNTPQATQGKSGQALNFFPNGSDGNSYVTMGDPGDGDLDFGSGDFSVGFWMKGAGYSSQGSSSNVPLAKKSFSTFTSAGHGFWYDSTNVLRFTMANGTTAYSVTQPVATVADNQWHYYVGTRSGTSTLTLYVDGVKVGENTTATGSVSNSSAFVVGTDSGVAPNDRNANAVIDEVRVYNTALTVAQVQSLYQLGASDKVNTSASQPQGTGRLDSGLAGYWAMDDGSGTSATDSSTNANTGTLTSGPTWSTGQIGGATDLDGDNDYITMGDPSSGVLDFGSDNFSVGFWMNGAGYSNQSASTNTAVSKRNDSSTTAAGYSFTYPSTNIMSFTIGNGSTNFSASHTVATAGDNTWHHYVGTRIGSTIYLFVDGALVDTQSVSGSVSNTTDFQIGDSGTLGTRNSNALFDEVRVYNRTLSADEISQLYRLTSPTAVDTGLKGYWSFNAQDMSGTTAYDRSGAGNTGTLTSGPTKVLGKLGQGLDFDNSDDYVSIADNAALDIGDTEDLTLMGWFNRDTITTDDTIIAKRNGIANTDDGYILYIDDTTDKLTFEVSENSGTDEYQLESTTTFGPGWNHFAVVWDQDSATESEIYLNGVDNNATDTGTIGNLGDLANSVVLAIGAESDAGNPFDGKLDELRVYKRVLTAGEIKSQYDLGQADKTNTSISQPQGSGRLDSGLVNYWKFDENTGTSTTDSSTNAFTGTLTNGPVWTTGQIGSAINFDGTNDYVTATDSDDSKYTGELTLCVWANIEAAGNYRHFMGKHASSGGTANPFDFRTSTDNPPKMVLVRANTDYRSYNGPDTTLGQWKHYCVVAPAAIETVPTFYIDSVPTTGIASGGTGTGAATGSGAAIRMGSRADATPLMDGSMDEVRIYNRMLSADEIGQIYRLGASTTTDTSLKGYWSFNGQDMSGTTAYDRSGAGNSGTLTNGPAKTFGKIGQALLFDGTDDYVDAGTASSLKPSLPLTVSYWVKPTTVSTTQGHVGNREGTIHSGFWTAGNSDGSLSLSFGNWTGCDSSGRRTKVSPVSTLVANQWQHIVGIIRGDTDMTIYVNGVDVGGTYSGSAAGGMTYDAGSFLRLGSHGGGGGCTAQYLNGALDEVRLYNRELSSGEVISLYNQGR